MVELAMAFGWRHSVATFGALHDLGTPPNSIGYQKQQKIVLRMN